MRKLKWLAFYPFAVFSGLFVGGMILLLGNYLLGQWMIHSGVVVWMAAITIPYFWVKSGLEMAPEQSRLAKWVLLFPLLFVSILLLLGMISLFWSASFHKFFPEIMFSNNGLPEEWQAPLFSVGFIASTLYTTLQIEGVLDE